MARWEPDAVGRLVTAAYELYDRQGYEATTVSEIASAAGLTKRTYFRHFADKREVLFRGATDTQQAWVAAVRGAPASAGAVDAVRAGFAPLAAFFDGLHGGARVRARIVDANPELLERELSKLEVLVGALAAALRERGIADLHAELAARAGIAVYQSAFGRWVAQDDPDALGRLLDESLAELQTVVAPATRRKK